MIGYTDDEFECTEGFLSGLLNAGIGEKAIVEAWHGAFVFGSTAGEAFFRSFYLHQAGECSFRYSRARPAVSRSEPFRMPGRSAI